jgi:hypothetical protein
VRQDGTFRRRGGHEADDPGKRRWLLDDCLVAQAGADRIGMPNGAIPDESY